MCLDLASESCAHKREDLSFLFAAGLIHLFVASIPPALPGNMFFGVSFWRLR